MECLAGPGPGTDAGTGTGPGTGPGTGRGTGTGTGPGTDTGPGPGTGPGTGPGPGPGLVDTVTMIEGVDPHDRLTLQERYALEDELDARQALENEEGPEISIEAVERVEQARKQREDLGLSDRDVASFGESYYGRER